MSPLTAEKACSWLFKQFLLRIWGKNTPPGWAKRKWYEIKFRKVHTRRIPEASLASSINANRMI